MSPTINKPARSKVVLVKIYIKDENGNIFETTIDAKDYSALFWYPPQKTDNAFKNNITDNNLGEFENKIEKLAKYDEDFIKQKLEIPAHIDLTKRPSAKEDWSVEQTILGHYYEHFREDYKNKSDPKIEDKRQYGAAYVGAQWFKRCESKRNWKPVTQTETELKAAAAEKPAASLCSGASKPKGLTAALLKIPNCRIQNL